MHKVSERMTAYVMREFNLPYEAARAMQKSYLAEHGTTLSGLMKHHGTDPYHFLDEVHDVSLDGMAPDFELNALIAALPGQKIVFTNGDKKHAHRLLDHLQMRDLFAGVFHLEDADFIPKPHISTFDRMMQRFGVAPERAIFFEDSPRNLRPAHDLGMITVLVGPHAAENQDDFVHHRAPSLKAFLQHL